MKKLLLATGLVLAQTAGMHAFAQTSATPTPSTQANGEKSTVPADPKSGVDGRRTGGMAPKAGDTPARVQAPAPMTGSLGEKGTAPANPKSAADGTRAGTMAPKAGATPARVPAPTPTTEANGEKGMAPATGKGMAPAK
ncbi:hypothetical protein [Pseudorhodoferax sp. Leaf267]|uniref:hypothetical protein n=1 Tax=Pseudorhodoferax sp. Leaf267 TaxID=1736316 RepID=UPI0006F7FA50|nr:hypothetical protein [Pseudorhodoferax sp. Leaf267]KQP17767.1 hypothetical protein ASF43_07785 [Pseudorhodoferax sp. Leaf267]